MLQDIAQARSLLRSAGQQDLSFVLPTCDALPGYNPSATLFAQQAAAAGVKVSVNLVPLSTYYTPAGGYLSRPIGINYGAPFQSLTEVYRTFFTSSAPFNASRWGYQQNGPAAWKLIDEAIAATDPAKAQDLWGEVQRQQYDQGGVLVWTNSDDLAGVAKNVQGLKLAPVGYVNYFRFLDAWLSA